MNYKKQQGMTLIEITVVLLILIALAGLTIPYIGSTSSKVLCDATDITMANIKRAIMDRYYLDTLGYFPKKTKDITDFSDYSLQYLMTKPSEWNVFDPSSSVGWRGPYLMGSSALKSLSDLQSNFKSGTYVHQTLATGNSIILDGWGRPIILQVVNNTDCNDSLKWNILTSKAVCARLVSGGFGSGTGPGKADIETAIAGSKAGDDRVLYLNVPTPSTDINPDCN